MLTDLFKVYHATGIVEFRPDAFAGQDKFLMNGEEYDFIKVNVVDRDEHGGLVFRAVNTLSRVDGDDGEWMKMTGFYDQRIATTMREGIWAGIDVFRALDASMAAYKYLLRWEDGELIVPYLIKDHIDLADMLNRLRVLGEALK